MDPAVAATGDDGSRFDAWRRRSATGVVLTALALGLREALELPREEAPIVIDADGRPHDPDDPFELRFDPERPEHTVAVVRPWLLRTAGKE